MTLSWSDNADKWAQDASDHGTVVDQSPHVGSIAQWNLDTGEPGHVAYVEQVNPTNIVITMDDFYQSNPWPDGYTAEVKIDDGSPAWPDNFIHFADQGGGGGPVSTMTQLSSSQNPSTFGQNVTFTATVTPTSSSSSQPSGTVQFFDGGTSIGTESLGSPSSNQASVSTHTLLGGTHGITAQYVGDSNFSGSTSGSLGQVVNPISTATTVSSSSNPALTGQPVIYTASVSPSPDGGTVTITDNGASICTGLAVNTSTGQATCTVTYTPAQAGSHVITAAFSGDADFASSQSGSLTQVVLIPTTTAITSSANPSVPQEPVVFTATVNPIPDGGTVAFTDNGSPIPGCGAESVNATSGTATCPLTYTADGGHNIVAAYSGDGLYAPSQGTLVQAVVPIVVTVSPNPTIETGPSQVDAVVQVRADPKYAGLYVLISSPQLDASCGRRVLLEYLPSYTNAVALIQRNQIMAKVDGEGNATVDLVGRRCTPGTSSLEAQLEATSMPSANSPFPGASTNLVVEPPGASSPGIIAVPTAEVETGDNSAVYAVFNIQTTPALSGKTVTISSLQLLSSCPSGWAWVSNLAVEYGNAPQTVTSHGKLDINGAAVFVFEGIGCAAGSSTVTAVVGGTTYSTQFSVLPPQP